MNDHVLGIYVPAGGSKCLLVIVDSLVSIGNISGLNFNGDV